MGSSAGCCAHGSYYIGLAVKGMCLALCGPILAYTGLLPPFRGLILDREGYLVSECLPVAN